MSSAFQKNTSNIFVTLLIGLIVISFMFTGFETMQGTPDTVAKVNGEPIKAREFQQEYERQLNFFAQFYNGGQPLNNAQIEQFQLKEQTIRNLVSRKLMVNFAEDMGIQPAVSEVKAELQTMPYFLTGNQFDLQKYKSILAANGLTPGDFEADILAGIKSQRAGEIISILPLSNSLMQDIAKYKKEAMGAHLVRVNKTSLERHIPVTNSEIKEYLTKDTNTARIEEMFKDRKPSLDQAEQVEARHILLRTDGSNDEEVKGKIADIKKEVTARNFANLAKKYTEDPSGKDNGGYLDWFARGSMVPEFEQVAFSLAPGSVSEPVKTDFGYHLIYVIGKKEATEAKLEDYRETFAKELLQKSKTAERESLIQSLTENIEKALNASNKRELQALESKYGFTLRLDTQINRLEGATSEISLTAKETGEIFEKGLEQSDTYLFDKPSEVVLVKTFKLAGPVNIDSESDRAALTNILGGKMRQDLMEALNANASVNVYDSRINL